MIALFFGCVISFALAFSPIGRAGRTGRSRDVASILYTIPSIALFALLIPFTGLGMLTAEIALVSYTILILVGNTVAGLDAVPDVGQGSGRRHGLHPVGAGSSPSRSRSRCRRSSPASGSLGDRDRARHDRRARRQRRVRRADQRRTPPQLSDPDRDRRHAVDHVWRCSSTAVWRSPNGSSRRGGAPNDREIVVNIVREAIEFLLTTGQLDGRARASSLAGGRTSGSRSSPSRSPRRPPSPSAVWLAHKRRAPNLSIAMVNLGRAIPSFAIIALVFPFSIRYGFGLGFWPTCVALVALGIPPMFTNAYAGVMETRERHRRGGVGHRDDRPAGAAQGRTAGRGPAADDRRAGVGGADHRHGDARRARRLRVPRHLHRRRPGSRTDGSAAGAGRSDPRRRAGAHASTWC